MASDFWKLAGAAMKVSELIEGDLRTFRVVHEPPGVSSNGGNTNIDTDDHVAEE